MTALALRGFGAFPPIQFGSPNQHKNRYYNDGYSRNATSFAPHYPSKPLYQPPFNPMGGYSSNGYDRLKPPGMGAQFLSFMNELDAEYRYDQYLSNLEKMQKRYWRQQGNYIPPPMYTGPLGQFPQNYTGSLATFPQNYTAPYAHFPQNYTAPYPPFQTNYSIPLQPFPSNYFTGPMYEYQHTTRYLPYPIYIQSGRGGYGMGSNFNFESGGGANLTPKVRVIFMPTGYSSYQQACTGALAMPSFLYNRVAQPWCSFPAPPPLPQLASLPLTPAVQQMVMQRYSNPVAVLPFSSNWQMPQQMMSGWPQFQQQQPMMPTPAFQSLPPAPQSYIPPPMPAFQSFPPAPQSYIPPPMQDFQSFPPAPQSYIPSPMPAFSSYPPAPQSYIPPPMPDFQSFPPAPQSYIPPPMPAFQSWLPAHQSYIPPPTMPTSLPILPPPPLPTTNTGSSVPQYSNTGYPSTCRACPPAPPPLNITVQGHCWVQHCSACHHVPIPTGNANTRPVGGRITPLLRRPTVPQYVPDQTIEQNYVHSNAPVMIRPWLRKTPPLPPGAILISDEYIDEHGCSHIRKAPPLLTYPILIPQGGYIDENGFIANGGYTNENGFIPQHRVSRKQHRHHRHSSGPVQRSATITSSTTSTTPAPAKRERRSVSPSRKNQNQNINNNNSIQPQEPIKSKRVTSSSSSPSTSSTSKSVENQKLASNLNKTKQAMIPEESSDEAHDISLRYKYQPQEVSSVYLINRYIKSSSEASTLSLNAKKTPVSSPSSVIDYSPIPSPSIDLASIEESTKETEDEKKSRLPSEFQPKKKIIIIRQIRSNSSSSSSSSSTITAMSSNAELSIINKDSDSIPTSKMNQ